MTDTLAVSEAGLERMQQDFAKASARSEAEAAARSSFWEALGLREDQLPKGASALVSTTKGQLLQLADAHVRVQLRLRETIEAGRIQSEDDALALQQQIADLVRMLMDLQVASGIAQGIVEAFGKKTEPAAEIVSPKLAKQRALAEKLIAEQQAKGGPEWQGKHYDTGLPAVASGSAAPLDIDASGRHYFAAQGAPA